MDTATAAQLTGMKESEVLDVTDSPAGDVINLADGTTMIFVDSEHPDADGKSGLMYLSAPHDPYFGTFPVYAQPVEAATEPAAEVAPEPSEPAPVDAVPEPTTETPTSGQA